MTREPVTIVTFRPELRADFERLNRGWLEEHSLLEPADLHYLQHPEETILAPGGEVFFAMRSGQAVGCCAALPLGGTVVELAKLAVDPSAQGQGLGRHLAERVIQFARDRGATSVVLTSHTALTAALRLYESLGFRHAPLPADVRYETANVYMELSLAR